MTDDTRQPYDALLVLSFGGPEGPDDVLPFLENVLRGKNVPRQRMLEVAEHYQHFGGVSPINAQNRALIAALEQELDAHGPALPIYWGNRNWHPMLADTLRIMRDDGIRRALVFVTSVFSSYSGCRQYREDLEKARAEIGPDACVVEKLRTFYNHPGFIESVASRIQDSLNDIPESRRPSTQIVFTAHSIPLSMAAGCDYEMQLKEACGLVSKRLGHEPWRLVYQSRSGPPQQPWLEPDICAYLEEVHSSGKFTDVVICPIGFVSDHMEVLFDLDTEARALCDRVGLNMIRAGTVGTHPRFVRMIRELILERTDGAAQFSLGSRGPSHDVCPLDCCLSGRRPLDAKGNAP